MTIEGSGATRARQPDHHNEDVFLVEEGLGLYVVCDGMESTPAGEVAAQIAARAVEEFVAHAGGELDLDDERTARAVVDKAIVYALDALTEASREDPGFGDSTTTITLLLAHGSRGIIGHRGDSRAYLIRRDRSQQLTVDHELTEADPSHLDFDVFSLRLQPGDTVVLCSDGAEQVMEDRAIIRAAGGLSPRLLASRIVSAAHRAKPESDATAVVVRVRGERERGWLELSNRPVGTSFGHTLEYA